MGKIFIGTLVSLDQNQAGSKMNIPLTKNIKIIIFKLLSWFLIATIEAHGDFDVPMVKRDDPVNDCERSAAMVALRACRKYCSQNYRKFPGKMLINIKIENFF